MRVGSLTMERLVSEEIKKMSFEDIFLSSDYQSDLSNLMHTACMRVGYKKYIGLNIFNDPEKEDIAYTDGNVIYLNLGMTFASRLKKKPDLFHTFVVGLIAHELGHVFWTEFGDGEKYMNSLKNGMLYPSVPNHPNAIKFVDALKETTNRIIFCEILHSLDNILEDVYVNALQEEMLGGLYSKGIQIGNIMITEEMDSIQQQKDKGFYDFNIIMNCLITRLKSGTVVYSKYNDEYSEVVERVACIAEKYIFKETHKERVEGINLMVCELWEYIEEMLADIKQKASQNGGSGSSNENSQSSESSESQSNSNASGEQQSSGKSQESSKQSGGSQNQNSDSRESSDSSQESSKGSTNTTNNSGNEEETSGCNNGKKNGDESSQQKGDSNDASEEKLDTSKLNELLENAIEQLQGKTKEANNQPTSPIAGSHKAMASPQKSETIELPKTEDNERFPMSPGEAIMALGSGETIYERDFTPESVEASRTLIDVLSRIAQKRAEYHNENDTSNKMAKEVADIDYGPIHKDVFKRVKRVSPSSSSKNQYESLRKEVMPIVEKLVKVIKRTIKEENLSGERRGRYFGKKLDNQRLYRPDLKVWKDSKKPKKEIDCAFSILIDVSGSMHGLKLDVSRLVAIMFAEACEKLDIPLEVTGHSTIGYHRGVELFNFISFDSLNKKDKYSLPLMSCQGCNRDGAALIYGLERLKKRKESKKVFCIISDGQPNDTNYYGEAAKSDMKHIKNKYSKDGITFVAAAIDSDKDFIKEIYGKNFLNISYLESMPQTFGKILQNSVLD